MKVIFNTQDLNQAFDKVQPAAQIKVTSNTNNGFFIIAKNNTVQFQANDYTIGIKTSCPASIKEEGSVVIAAPQLLTTLRMMPSSTITMEQIKENNLISFTSGTYKSIFPIRNQNDFPEIKEIDHSQNIKIKSKELSDMVNKVQFAASTDKQKPFFTGILFEITNSTFTMAATNTHRLATKTIAIDERTSSSGRFIVPANIMSDVIKLFSDTNENIEISWTNNHVAFAFKDTYFLSTLINGEYPDYKRVIPQSFDSHAELNLNEFEEAVRFVSPISRNVDYKTINFYFENESLKIYEEDAEIGTAETFIPLKLQGDPIKITFNCNYIEDILKHSKGKFIILHLLKSGPMLVEQEEDKSYKYVVTPMRGR